MTNTKLIELVFNGSNPLVQRENVTRAYAHAETIVYGDLKKGYVTCRKSIEGWMLNKQVELPAACPMDHILKPTWRNYVKQVEVNLTGIFSKAMILNTKTGESRWYNGFGLADLGCTVSKGKHPNVVVVDPATGEEVIIARINYKEKGYEFNSFALNEQKHILGHLLRRSREIVEMSRGVSYGVMPVHPDWIVAEPGKARYNLMMVTDTRLGKFAKVLFDRMDEKSSKADRLKALLRIGKDILSTYIGETRQLNILVLDDRMLDGNPDLLCDDGDVNLRNTKNVSELLEAGAHGLIKGVGRNADGKVFVVKGRAKNNENIAKCHPDMETMLPSWVDGWTRMGQVKFAPVQPGTVVSVTMGMVKDEQYAEREAYAVNTAALYVADLDDAAHHRLGNLLRISAKKVARSLTSISGNLNRTLETGFAEEDGSAVLNGRMAKYALGFTGSLPDERNAKWVKSLTQKASAIKDESVTRAGISFSDRVAIAVENDGVFEYRIMNVPVDGFLMSEGLSKVVDTFAGEPVTLLRYPVLTKTSYLDVEPGALLPGFAGRYMFAHPMAAAKLGGDGDDWGNLVFGLHSNVKPSTDIPAIDKHCPTVSLDTITPETAYIWGMASQAMVGAYTNALHEAVLFGADPNDGPAMLIAQSVQALVQGVKKPNLPVISFAKAKKIAAEYREAASIIMSERNFDDAANLWTITHKGAEGMEKIAAIESIYDFPTINVEAPMARKAGIVLTADENHIVSTIVAEYAAKHIPVTRLNRTIVDALVSYYGIVLETAAKKDFDRLVVVYLEAYNRLYTTVYSVNGMADLAVEHANGALLWWGNTIA